MQSVFRCVGFLILALLSSLRSLSADEITLAQAEAYYPFMAKDENGANGIYRDILEATAQRLKGHSFNVVAMPWSRATEVVKSGGAQGLIGSYYVPEARPWIRVFSEPIFTEEVFVYCRKGVAQADWIYPNDYKGLIFGNNTSFRTPGRAFFSMVDKGEIMLQEAQTTELNLKMLNIGRVDCYVQERLAAQLVIIQNNLKNVERISAVSSETVHIGYSSSWVGKDADRFIFDMNKILIELKADGTIARIINNYLQPS